MNATTLRPTQFTSAVRSLWSRFQLAGPRQATRTQLVRFLAAELEIPLEQAGDLFDQLQAAGIIFRGDDNLFDAFESEDDGQAPTQTVSEAAANGHTPASNGAPAASNTMPAAPRPDQRPAIELLRRAMAARATDVHLDPYGDEIEVRFRIDGRLEHFCRLSADVGQHVQSQLKVLGNLDVSDPFHPQEGRLTLPLALADCDVRITTTRVAGGESSALRLSNRAQVVRPLSELGMSPASLAKIDELLKLGEGVVLVAGPSASGKTTTAYSLVHALDDGHRNIVTIEDPVEYQIPTFVQMELDQRHAMTLGGGLKTLLRMDPDVVLVGEIRDCETATVAMRAASCGKFVFSTFHTRDAASVLTALRDLEVDARSLASNLRAIISQRLVRRLCRQCANVRQVDDSQREFFAAAGISPPEMLPYPVGCETCRGTGYFERIGVFEIAANADEVGEAIRRGATEDELRSALRDSGVASLAADGLQKVRDGVTTLEEIQAMSWIKLPGRS